MRTKHWLPLFSSLVAVSVIAACGTDDDSPSMGSAGRTSGGAGGAHAGAPGGGAGGAHAGAPGGGATTTAGAANGGANAGAGDTKGDSGSAGAEDAGAGGMTGGTSGAGGSTAGAGGSTAGAGGAGGVPGIDLCSKSLWKNTFQFCSRTAAFGSGVNQPTNAVDDDVTTFVTSGAGQDGTFFAIIDLHGAANVSSFVLDYGTGQTGNKESDFSPVKLQGSNTGTAPADFTDIPGATATAVDNHKMILTVPPDVTHRYLKLVQVGTSGSWWPIPEINLACTSKGTPAVPVSAVGAVARAGWKVLTPNSLCTPIANVLDDSLTTKWQSEGPPGIGYWVRVDLGAPVVLTNVDFKVDTGNTTDFPAKVKLQTSLDDITYVDAVTNVSGAIDTLVVLNAPTTARFFRIVSEADTAGGTSWWSIADLQVNVSVP